MRLPIILGANPRLANQNGFHSVVLPGRWRIISENLTDSKVELESVRGLKLSVGDEFEVDIHTGFKVTFLSPGTERTISIFAERVA